MHQAAGGRCVFPATEGRLRAERLSEFLIGDDLQGGIMAQAIGIVGVLVAGDDLIDALPQQRQRAVLHALLLTRVAEQRGPVPRQMMTLIEGSQCQQAGITGDLSTRKIGSNGSMLVGGKRELWDITRWYGLGAPKENVGFAKNPGSSIFYS